MSNLIEQSLDESGLQAKKPYQLRLPSDTSKDYYAIHRLTENTEPIIIEYSSLKDTERANDINNNWQKYTEAVVKALAEYLGVVYDQDSNIYVVQKGDTLWSIARKFNTSVSEIKQLNNLSTNSLSINQKLKIPSYETTPSTAYTVQSGDSLYKIANKYNVTVEELKKANNLTSNILSINQVLIIPSSEQTKPLENKDIIYTVKKGDNLYNIAKSYNTTVSAIMSYNNLKTNLLNINQQLKIPTSSQNIYVVQSGDNLYNIAKKYNTTVDKIKQANNLSSNLLSIGQKLII